MKKNALTMIATSALFIASAAAIAQPATQAANPAAASASSAASTAAPVMAATPTEAGRYIGPSSAALTTVKQLLASGKDDQYARLQGKITSHDHGKKYTFADDSGSMSVEISPKRFPEGQTIGAEQRVELAGKLDKGWNKMEFLNKGWSKMEFEVKEIRLLP